MSENKPKVMDVGALAAPGLRTLKPYQPGKPISELEREYGVKNIIKLASNENPLGCSPKAMHAMQNGLQDVALYPDGSGFDLKQTLAQRHDLDPACVTLGNGSNDVLVLLAEAFLTPECNAVFSQYSFAAYSIAVQAVSAQARVAPALPADADQPLGHDLNAMRALVDEHTRLVFIANPNNPTGSWLEADALYDFIQDMPEGVLVVVDEAYHEYALEAGVCDAAVWLRECPNLVVCRTFSKVYGLAGIRVGYSLSSVAVADMLNRIRQPFNVNSLALVAAEAALHDHEFVRASVDSNAKGLQQLRQGLLALGFAAPASAGNFVLTDVGVDADACNEYLLRHGVIVRPVANYGLSRHLRITVGTESQNQQVLKMMAAWQQQSG